MKNKKATIEDTSSKFIRSAHVLMHLPLLSLNTKIRMLLTLSRYNEKKMLTIECPMKASQVIFSWTDKSVTSTLIVNETGAKVRQSLANYFEQPIQKLVSPGSWIEKGNMRFKSERKPMVFDGIHIAIKPKKKK